MNKKLISSLLISAGVIGGIALSTNQAKADSNEGTVTTVRQARLYNNKGDLVKNRSLAANTPWYTDGKTDLNNVGSAYRVSTNEYVKVDDVQFSASGSSSSNISSGDTSVKNSGTLEIAYAPTSGIDLYQGYGPNKSATGTKLVNGTQWKFTQKVIDANGDAWYEIGGNQWVSGQYTKVTNEDFSESSAKVWDPNFAALKVTGDTPVYYDSSWGTATSQTLAAGTIVEVDSTVQSGNVIWYEISNGGWLPSTTTSTIATTRSTVSLNGKSKDEMIADVIKVAKQQLGKPYVWNAKGPNSFDCSGLMQYVFGIATGQNIGSWTVPQETAGTKVALSDLQPGDLLFWGPEGASYHVALYLGNNQYLNALRPGTNVKIDSITSSFAPSFGVRIFQ
ncbi:C40 family peptidase [Companilactobacillus sp.]|uniref:C40 family peptidase n=1 Tax=Companilactobacillus sp. TaxID=2767905 RepID=UPI002631B34A|nr:C40 family peptidase [Companilactobacillus sp.]